ncbi:cobalamin biosynthesis protein CobW, partial [Escherichia coli]|nr:cobalamin biosynthesis protein CobW [Escherichia coli]
MPSIPVTILHGFLGSGKTTFLRNILQQADYSGVDLSVIVND